MRERVAVTGIRKTAARRVTQAWTTVPHIVQMVDVDASALLAARAAQRVELPTVTVNDPKCLTRFLGMTDCTGIGVDFAFALIGRDRLK